MTQHLYVASTSLIPATLGKVTHEAQTGTPCHIYPDSCSGHTSHCSERPESDFRTRPLAMDAVEKLPATKDFSDYLACAEKAASWSPRENCKNSENRKKSVLLQELGITKPCCATKNQVIQKLNQKNEHYKSLIDFDVDVNKGPWPTRKACWKPFMFCSEHFAIHKMGCFVGSKWLKIFAAHLIL